MNDQKAGGRRYWRFIAFFNLACGRVSLAPLRQRPRNQSCNLGLHSGGIGMGHPVASKTVEFQCAGRRLRPSCASTQRGSEPTYRPAPSSSTRRPERCSLPRRGNHEARRPLQCSLNEVLTAGARSRRRGVTLPDTGKACGKAGHRVQGCQTGLGNAGSA